MQALNSGGGSPFIVKLYANTYSEMTSSFFFMMEFIQGGDLFFQIRKSKRFAEDRARQYAAEILMALDYIHQCRIIYRDLKPENVLIDKQGHIKIIDFGLSKIDDRRRGFFKLFSSSKDSDKDSIFVNSVYESKKQLRQSLRNPHKKLQTKTVCGTPEYIAPEVLLDKSYTCAVDYYGLGLLIFEMLAGYNPYKVNVQCASNPKKMMEFITDKSLDLDFPKGFP